MQQEKIPANCCGFFVLLTLANIEQSVHKKENDKENASFSVLQITAGIDSLVQSVSTRMAFLAKRHLASLDWVYSSWVKIFHLLKFLTVKLHKLLISS